MPKTSVAALEVPPTSSILQWYHILNEATYYYLACEAWDVQIDAKDVEIFPWMAHKICMTPEGAGVLGVSWGGCSSSLKRRETG